MASARWPTGSQSSLGHITETGLNLRYIILNTCIPMAVLKSHIASNGGRELQREVGDLRKYDESVKMPGLQSPSQL